MTSPTDVARFHAEYDRHPDNRVGLFEAVSHVVPRDVRVLYPGSYVDISPSVWFDDVTYVDIDKRTPRFFAQTAAVRSLIESKRRAAGSSDDTFGITFHHADYCDPFPVESGSVDLLVSLYAGFISERCSRYLRPGGVLLANNSHGDASMASLDDRAELVGVVQSRDGTYTVTTDQLDRFLDPKRGTPPTRDELHTINRGITYTKPAFGYLFAFN